MKYVTPDDYEEFRCLADRCPDTCCRGWQIVIDRESLIRYSEMPGPIGNRVRNSVDWRTGCFLQEEEGCVMQGDEGLCDLQLEAGAEALCETCRLYPRHEEEYDHVREYSLSLSCPEAARMAVSRETPLRFAERETEEDDDFDEFDGALFAQLSELRRLMTETAQNRELPLEERLRRVELLGRQAQKALEEGRGLSEEAMKGEAEQKRDGLSGKSCWLPEKESQEPVQKHEKTEIAALKKRLSLLREVSVRDERWETMLDRTWDRLCTEKEEVMARTREWMKKYSVAGEQILCQLLYVYLCGAVYDRQIAPKSSLAVFCVRCIFLAAAGNAPEDRIGDPGEREKSLLTEAVWRLARTVEHDDDSLLQLENTFL